jgi:Bacterial flagellin N-terminal helical region
MLIATSANATQTALSSGLDTLNQTIGDVSASTTGKTSDATSPAALLSNFTDALQSYEASPSDSTLASAAVSAAATLTQGLNSAAATVNQVREQADSGIATSVQSINSLLTQFQSVNAQIVNGTAIGSDVTDAQDSRDNRRIPTTPIIQPAMPATRPATRRRRSAGSKPSVRMFHRKALIRALCSTPRRPHCPMRQASISTMKCPKSLTSRTLTRRPRTQSISSAMCQSILRMQTELAACEAEVSTGNYADIGQTLGAQTGENVSLQAQKSLLQTITDTNQTVATRLSTTETILGNLRTNARIFATLSRKQWLNLKCKRHPSDWAKRPTRPDLEFKLFPQWRLHFWRDEYR